MDNVIKSSNNTDIVSWSGIKVFDINMDIVWSTYLAKKSRNAQAQGVANANSTVSTWNSPTSRTGIHIRISRHDMLNMPLAGALDCKLHFIITIKL